MSVILQYLSFSDWLILLDFLEQMFPHLVYALRTIPRLWVVVLCSIHQLCFARRWSMEFLPLTSFVSTYITAMRWLHEKQLEKPPLQNGGIFIGMWLRKNDFLCLHEAIASPSPERRKASATWSQDGKRSGFSNLLQCKHIAPGVR